MNTLTLAALQELPEQHGERYRALDQRIIHAQSNASISIFEMCFLLSVMRAEQLFRPEYESFTEYAKQRVGLQESTSALYAQIGDSYIRSGLVDRLMPILEACEDFLIALQQQSQEQESIPSSIPHVLGSLGIRNLRVLLPIAEHPELNDMDKAGWVVRALELRSSAELQKAINDFRGEGALIKSCFRCLNNRTLTHALETTDDDGLPLELKTGDRLVRACLVKGLLTSSMSAELAANVGD